MFCYFLQIPAYFDKMIAYFCIKNTFKNVHIYPNSNNEI